MENAKSTITPMGIGILIGAIVTLGLLSFGARLSEVSVGPLKFAVPTPTVASLPTGIPSIAPQAKATDAANWLVNFDYRFPANFWTIGSHSYLLETFCPTFADESTRYRKWNHTFEVSADTSLVSGDVFLRLSGLKDSQFRDIGKIHPSQPTVAGYTLSGMSRAEAELAFRDCRVTISWDKGQPRFLVVGTPFQR